MRDHGRPSLARFLAPIALVAFAVAVLAVVSSSQVTDDDDQAPTAAEDRPAATATETTPERGEGRTPASYTVQTNDTLSGIAEQTGVSLERIQELNPDLDPQGLVAGQRIRLR